MEAAKTVILCVDDEEIPRTLRKLILQKQGYEVIAASSAEEALVILTDRVIGLVLTDQIMPGIVGTELTKRVKASTPDMPVIIISGVNEIPADASFADRFISKVEGPEALFRGIAEVLEQYRRKGQESSCE
ncbi:MAG: response regulator [Acidobacteriaceae bacterium]